MQDVVVFLERFGPFLLIGYFALNFALTALYSYTLQAISDKTSELPSWFAWVPLIQIHAFLCAADIRYRVVFAWIGTGIALAITGALLAGAGSPSATVAALLAAYTLAMVVWLLLVFWRLAERRGLSGWVGLACCIPVAGLFFFAYLALHDGSVRASRFGLALTALLALGGTLSLHQSLDRVLGMLSDQGRPAAVQGSGEERELLQALLHSWRGASGPGGSAGVASEDGTDPLERARAWSEALAGDERPRRVASAPDGVACGPGTRLAGERPPHGRELYCERDGVKHGRFLAWHPNGIVSQSGSYENGQRQGVWVRFRETGVPRAQVSFEADREHGVLVLWDEQGRVEREIRYVHGEPATP